MGLLHKNIAFNLKISNTICCLVTLFRHSHDEFAIILDNFDLILSSLAKKKYFLLLTLDDFNTKLSQWYSGESSISEGMSIESITTQFKLHHITNEPTHDLQTYAHKTLIWNTKPGKSTCCDKD